MSILHIILNNYCNSIQNQLVLVESMSEPLPQNAKIFEPLIKSFMSCLGTCLELLCICGTSKHEVRCLFGPFQGRVAKNLLPLGNIASQAAWVLILIFFSPPIKCDTLAYTRLFKYESV